MRTGTFSRYVAFAWVLFCSLPRVVAQGHSESESVLENRALRLVATPGQPGVMVYFKSERGGKRMEVALLASGAAQSMGISKAEVVKSGSDQNDPRVSPGTSEVKLEDDQESILRVRAGTAEADFSLGASGFVKINPGKNAASVEVRADAADAGLPDFFANDVVFDPIHLALPTLTVPAENFLLQLVEGGNTIVMCIWPGRLKQSEANAAGGQVDKQGAEPQVDLVFAGEGKARRVSAARIEFQNKPVYAGILEHKGVWQDEDAGALPGYDPTAIAWKRPFEARWRGDFVVAEDQHLADWFNPRSQSLDLRSTTNVRKENADPLDARFLAATSSKRSANWWEQGIQWWEKGDENKPQIWQESLASFFIYPAVFKGDESRLCLYTDKKARNKPHVYERVIIYPLGRVTATPLDVFTPVDLMRETLGQGPCVYILDLAGIKPRQAGGDRPTLAYATCGLWDDHIKPIIAKLKLKKEPDGTFEPLDEKTKAHLSQALEDMWYFVHAIHDRLREYQQWGAETDAFCKEASART